MNQETDFQADFFFWKLRPIRKFWIQNYFCAILRGWDISKTKWGSEIDRFIFILNLKWPSQHQNCLEMSQLTADWPGHSLMGPKLPKLVSQGLHERVRGHSRHLEAKLALLKPLLVIPNMPLSILEPNVVLRISQSLNIAQKWFCIKNLHMDLSFQKKKNSLEIRFLVPEIF